MKKTFQNYILHIKSNLIWFFASLIIGGGIFCLYFFLNGQTMLAACNGCALVAICLICFALLMLVTRFGAFDSFAYGFRQLGSAMFSKEARPKEDYHDFRDRKKQSRENGTSSFLSVFLSGILALIALLVLEIIFHSIYG